MNWEQLLRPIRFGKSQASDITERSPFDKDYDRVIFSQAFRRLQDKTQVFPLPEDSFVHTRLTHSLEVSSVARSLGRIAGKTVLQRHGDNIPEEISELDFGTITATAALAHDIGNPPFGHSGEQVLSDFFTSNKSGQFFKSLVTQEQWSDLVNFEGNAQGFRLLNSAGFTLTYPVLGAFTKYPRPSSGDFPKGVKSFKKFGFFETEKQNFDDLAEALGMINGPLCYRHPLAYLVEAADDICYHIIDLEDGAALGLISNKETVELLSPLIPDSFDWKKFENLPSWIEKIGVLRAVAINQLINDAVEVFLDNEEQILSGTMNEALVDVSPKHNELDQIISISIEKLYRAKVVNEIEAAGYHVLNELMDSLLPAFYKNIKKSSPGTKEKIIFRLFPEHHKSLGFVSGLSDYQIVRIVLDYVSGLSDSYAISLYKKIKGIELPQL